MQFKKIKWDTKK